MRTLERLRIGSLLAPLMASPLCSAMDIDGRLVEPEWESAQRFTQFLTTDPLSLETPPYRTEAWVLARPEGLFIGVIAQVPRALRTYGQSPRDAAPMDADPISIVVDFEGQGRSAYEFTVSLSNSGRDGIFLGQSKVSYDWDGTWYHAVSEDDENWYLEVQLPWSVARKASAADQHSRLGIWIQRDIKALQRGYAFPAMEIARPTFVSDLQPLELPSFNAAEFDLFPYVAANRDLLAGSSKGRAGLDLFWKPDGGKQLALTLNPDFGQVESDDLVVNFTAIETFFSEKRPFFIEGQSLFDLRTTNEGRIVNTRRIGAAPDAGSEGNTELVGAAKFTGLAGPLEYGAFAAVEEDSSRAEGRRYAVARLRHKSPNLGIGYLGTFVDRPTLDRQAQVHVIDADWLPRPGLSIVGQLIGSRIDQSPVAANGLSALDRHGYGAWMQARYSPGERLEQDLNLSWFDRNLEINDLGYLQRNSLRELQSITQIHTRQFAADSPLAATFWRFNTRLKYNDLGERLPATVELGHFWRFREPYSLYAYYYGSSSGYDDLITFGNGIVKLPPHHEAGVQYQFNSGRRFRIGGEAYMFQEGVSGDAWRLTARPTWIITRDLTLGLELGYLDSRDWLIWRSGAARLATHERQLLSSVFEVNWFPARRQELRVKTQWIALRARALQAYLPDAAGNLHADPTPIEDFSLGQFGLQIRYRFELQPLSDLYVVYSRGGFVAPASQGEFGTLFEDATSTRTADQFLVKLRYRF